LIGNLIVNGNICYNLDKEEKKKIVAFILADLRDNFVSKF